MRVPIHNWTMAERVGSWKSPGESMKRHLEYINLIKAFLITGPSICTYEILIVSTWHIV